MIIILSGLIFGNIYLINFLTDNFYSDNDITSEFLLSDLGKLIIFCVIANIVITIEIAGLSVIVCLGSVIVSVIIAIIGKCRFRKYRLYEDV